jgi:intracellular multiplication protein IcmC
MHLRLGGLEIQRVRRVSLLFVLASVLSGCTTSSWPSLGTMLQNIANIMPELIQMVTAASYIFGLSFILKAIYKLREYGELRTMTSSQTSIVPPIVMLAVGGLLIYFPSAYQIGLMTLFDYSSPLSYADGASSTSAEFTSALLLIMQFIGAIAFIKGLMMMNHASGQGSQPGTFSKALTHMIGGLCAINVYGTWTIISNTLMGT